VMGLADLFSRLTSVLSLFGQLLLLVNLPLLLMSQVTINWFAILILIFAPHLSALAQLGLSRTREYDADLNASRLTGDPEGLARALTAIDRLQGDWLERVLLPGRRLPEPSLLRTHPPTQQRVARLLALQRSVNARHLPLRIDRPSGVDVLSDDGIRRAPRWHISGLWH
jgi:heat shock protein HtpX